MALKDLNLMWNPFRKGLNKARYQGDMHCASCSKHVDPTTTPIGFESDKPRMKFIGNLGPFIREYQCKYCGAKCRYDMKEEILSPYSSFKRGLNQLPGVRYSGRVPLINK